MVVDPSVAVAFRTPLRVVPYVTAEGCAHAMVVVIGLRPVPLTATFCVALLPLRWLSVTSTFVLRLPDDCGVNETDTSQTPPGSRDVLEVHRSGSELFSGKSAV